MSDYSDNFRCQIISENAKELNELMKLLRRNGWDVCVDVDTIYLYGNSEKMSEPLLVKHEDVFIVRSDYMNVIGYLPKGKVFIVPFSLLSYYVNRCDKSTLIWDIFHILLRKKREEEI